MIHYCNYKNKKIMFDTTKQKFHAWINGKDIEAESAAEVMAEIDKEKR